MAEPTDEELGIDENLDPNIRAELRHSRIAKQEAEAAKAELAEAKREAAFARAGIPDTPLGQLFTKAFDGDISDPEAIKASFEALAPQQQEPPPQEVVTDQELDQQRRLSQVGTTAPSGGDVKFEDALASAKSESEVMDLIANAPATATDSEGRRVSVASID